jgi:hypothetical protein
VRTRSNSIGHLDKGKRVGFEIVRYPRLRLDGLTGPRVWQIMIRIGRKVPLA